MKYTVDQLINAMESKGYTVFTKGDYNINTVGVRTSKSGDKVSNKFDDYLYVFYKVNGKYQIYEYPCTTIAGLVYFKNPMLPDFGTAILVPGQYRASHCLGWHYGHPALQQVGNLKLFRDKNRDDIIDCDWKTINAGSWFGINIHYSSNQNRVDNWSAGCQVIQSGPNDPLYKQFLSHYQKAVKYQGNSFTYTLLESNDLNI